MSRCKTNAIQHGTAANHHDVAAAIQIRYVENLEHLLQYVNVVLNRFAAGHILQRAHTFHSGRIRLAERFNVLNHVRVGGGYVGIEPKLNAGRSVAGGFEQIEQYGGIGGEAVFREPQAMRERYREAHIELARGIVSWHGLSRSETKVERIGGRVGH